MRGLAPAILVVLLAPTTARADAAQAPAGASVSTAGSTSAPTPAPARAPTAAAAPASAPTAAAAPTAASTPAPAPASTPAPAPTAAAAPAPASTPAPAPTAASAPASPGPAPTSPSSPLPAPVGLGVVALPSAAGAAWPLAQAVYGDASLRPLTIDEPHARVLCGEPPAADATQDLRDLADTVAAIHGDDAPSRALLDGLARRFAVRGLVVVRPAAGTSPPAARVFVTATSAFDAASYAPDDAGSTAPSAGPSWSAAVQSLDRAFGQVVAAPLATHEVPPPDGSSPRHFYESGWFWGAIGLAALAGGAVFFATRDSSTPTIHLEAQVQH
jgi:hypothetical protein